MTETELKAQVAALIANKAKDLVPLMEEFAKSRFLVAASEYGENEDELEALQKISDAIKCTVADTGSGVSLSIDYDDADHGNYLDIIQNGMGAPLTGGTNGVVREPDGGTRLSKVPEQLWGNPVEEYAKEGFDVIGEMKEMLQKLFADNIRDLVSQSKSEIAGLAKPVIVQELRKAFRK